MNRRTFLSQSILAACAARAATLPAAPLARESNSAVPSRAQGLDFSQVTLTDGFWQPKQQKIATATLAACIYQTEQKTGRIRNFEKAARRAGERHEGIYYDDSDVYKALEAIAYSLKNRPDAALEAKADEWIAKIAAAQLPDGYLNTYYTLRGLEQRWTDMEKHEDYCGGHLIEAGIAYYRTTGKRSLLDVGTRFAEHLDATFRQPDRHWVSGHEEIELALMKLYGLTREPRYLKLAEWYLDQRGRGFGKGALWGEGKNPEYCQDTLPVKQQRRITGHAVRAMYLYSAVADVSAATGDASYMPALDAVWQDVVYRNLYVTGGIGSSGQNEGFTQAYDLPNAQAYCETCASVGMVFWNHRMALLTGESRYVDVLERSLYNGALDGLSLSGDRFFYGNPLAANGENFKGRSEWFGTACCPANIARLVASLGGYLYSVSDRDVWINLYAANSTRINIGGSEVRMEVATRYPWDGNVSVAVNPARRARFRVRLRIPGWARSEALPGDLYRFTHDGVAPVELQLNGRPVFYREEQGYAVIDREWRPTDVLELTLPMPVRQLTARDEVTADRNRVALQRGPLVYCVEGADNGGSASDFIVPNIEQVELKQDRLLDEPIIALNLQAAGLRASANGLNVEVAPKRITVIPFYGWANRGNYDMQVWLPRRIESLRVSA